MTDIVFVFEDSQGLMDVLRQNSGYSVNYTDEGLEKPEDSQGLWVGARIPFEDLQHIILESLERYDHLRYYSISTDFLQQPDFFHDMVVLGGLTSSAVGDKIRPIEPAQMTSRLRGMTSSSELFEFIRGHYPDDVPTYEPAAAGAEASEAEEPIRVLEYLDDSQESNRYALSINLIVDSPEEFIEAMRYVKEAYVKWITLRRDEAVMFMFVVAAAAEGHQEIDTLIREIYAEEEQLSRLLPAVDFDVTIEDSGSGATVHYVLERASD